MLVNMSISEASAAQLRTGQGMTSFYGQKCCCGPSKIFWADLRRVCWCLFPENRRWLEVKLRLLRPRWILFFGCFSMGSLSVCRKTCGLCRNVRQSAPEWRHKNRLDFSIVGFCPVVTNFRPRILPNSWPLIQKASVHLRSWLQASWRQHRRKKDAMWIRI